MNTQKLEQILWSSVDNRKIFGASLCISNEDETFTTACGNMQSNPSYFIASITKLYITAVFLQWRINAIIDLDDPICKYLSKEVTDKLHVHKGKDYSELITIRHLLSQTSGLPDYFEDKINGQSLLNRLTQGENLSWSFDDTIKWTKQMKPLFVPGARGKAHYSDTNFQLLGKIIENISKQNLEDVLNQLLYKELNLKNTWLYLDPNDQRPTSIYFNSTKMNASHALASFKADGGIVSTAAENMLFLKAFFEGKFFPIHYFEEMKNWNSVMFPLQYGLGIMRFKLPMFFSLFKPLPEFIGHSGLSGAFAFYVPSKKVYFTGTINQLASPSTSFKLMIKLLNNL